jgi:DNA-directed RNA polymerase subunit E'/Rpb7
MFMPIKFNTTIILTPQELTRDFDKTIINKVRSTLENCCSKHGYIKKDTIKIIKRSAGYFKEAHLNGNIAYDISCIAEICNPSQDSIIKCEVKAKNNLGLRAIGMYDNMAILEVIIPKITSGIQSDVNLSIDEEEDSELDETNYDGIELFNEEDEEEDEFNTDKLKSNSKGGKKGGLDFDEDDDDEEEEDEEEDDDDEGVDEEDIEGEDYGDDYDEPGGYIDD